MNKRMLGCVVLGAVALAGQAIAADLPARVYKAPAVAPALAYNWTGCYVGIEGGGAWGRSSHTAASGAGTGLPITGDYDLSGGLVGGTVGCNYQFSNIVIGIEDDLSWTNKKGSAFELAPFAAGATSQTREKWLDTLRGRVGVAFDRALLYGTGGVAFAGTDITACSPIGFCVSDSQNRTGWVAGAGIEYAIWNNLSVKVEYLHADFGTARYINTPIVGPNGGTFVTRDVKLTDDIVRAGLNWKFDLFTPGPVVTRY
jgi:outer membrane immunogenic protein